MNYLLAGLGILVILMIIAVVVLSLEYWNHVDDFDDNNDCGV